MQKVRSFIQDMNMHISRADSLQLQRPRPIVGGFDHSCSLVRRSANRRARAAQRIQQDLAARGAYRSGAEARASSSPRGSPENRSSSCAATTACCVRFYNVCRHHAAAVVTQPCGQASILHCPYHGWKYGLDGSLKGMPEFEGVREL